jgi:L-aspartate oxidase
MNRMFTVGLRGLRSNATTLLAARRTPSSVGARQALHYAASNRPDEEIQQVLRDRKTDVLVLGCGVAGSSTALRAAEKGLRVTMLTSAEHPHDCNSYWAQGGIIYKGKDDSPSLLSQDIITAGAGVNNPKAVSKLAVDGPACVDDLLIKLAQVPFDRTKEGQLALCLEASHNRARIIHWRDHTGRAITESLIQTVSSHPNITLVSGITAVELAVAADSGRCVGAYVLRNGEGGEVFPLRAGATVLATGGLGELYEHTSNPPSARGDGFAMAFRAGASLQNMEFVQFHPTTLFLPGERSFLLTEALRGEGARLLNVKGEAFAKRYHPAGELAPRDVVSRMIVSEMAATNATHVFLDISHRDPEWLRQRFPSINEHCSARGLDMTRQPLPVVPAAHYFCGGVATDLQGQTTVPGLYAAGEVACTGLHGANRLASTSLLEGLVWGVSIADSLSANHSAGTNSRPARIAEMAPLVPLEHKGDAPLDHAVVEAYMKKIQRIMWNAVGVVRRKKDLDEAARSLKELEREIDSLFARSRLSQEAVSLKNAVMTARLIARAALRNDHSVGAHYVVDEEADHAVEQHAVG